MRVCHNWCTLIIFSIFHYPIYFLIFPHISSKDYWNLEIIRYRCNEQSLIYKSINENNVLVHFCHLTKNKIVSKPPFTPFTPSHEFGQFCIGSPIWYAFSPTQWTEGKHRTGDNRNDAGGGHMKVKGVSFETLSISFI